MRCLATLAGSNGAQLARPSLHLDTLYCCTHRELDRVAANIILMSSHNEPQHCSQCVLYSNNDEAEKFIFSGGRVTLGWSYECVTGGRGGHRSHQPGYIGTSEVWDVTLATRAPCHPRDGS